MDFASSALLSKSAKSVSIVDMSEPGLVSYCVLLCLYLDRAVCIVLYLQFFIAHMYNDFVSHVVLRV